MTTTLVLVAGVAGSGKSTVAPRLAKRLGAGIVDIDRFKRELADPSTLTEGIDPPEVRWLYYQRALDQAFMLFAEGAKHVVVDEMFHVGVLRNRIESVCAERGITVKWIEVRCTDEIAERRIREKPRNGHILSTEQLLKIRQEVARAFDAFGEHDDHLVVMNVGLADASVDVAMTWLDAK